MQPESLYQVKNIYGNPVHTAFEAPAILKSVYGPKRVTVKQEHLECSTKELKEFIEWLSDGSAHLRTNSANGQTFATGSYASIDVSDVSSEFNWHIRVVTPTHIAYIEHLHSRGGGPRAKFHIVELT